MHYNPLPPIEDFQHIVDVPENHEEDFKLISEEAKPLQLMEEGKTLDITYLGTNTYATKSDIKVHVVNTEDGKPYGENGGIYEMKVKSYYTLISHFKDANDNYLASVFFTGSNFNPKMVICTKRPMFEGQQPSSEFSKHSDDKSSPLYYAWYQKSGNMPRSFKLLKNSPQGFIQSDYIFEFHKYGTCCCGLVETIGALSMYDKNRRRSDGSKVGVALFKNSSSQVGGANFGWDINIAPGTAIDPILIICCASIIMIRLPTS